MISLSLYSFLSSLRKSLLTVWNLYPWPLSTQSIPQMTSKKIWRTLVESPLVCDPGYWWACALCLQRLQPLEGRPPLLHALWLTWQGWTDHKWHVSTLWCLRPLVWTSLYVSLLWVESPGLSFAGSLSGLQFLAPLAPLLFQKQFLFLTTCQENLLQVFSPCRCCLCWWFPHLCGTSATGRCLHTCHASYFPPSLETPGSDPDIDRTWGDLYTASKNYQQNLRRKS